MGVDSEESVPNGTNTAGVLTATPVLGKRASRTSLTSCKVAAEFGFRFPFCWSKPAVKYSESFLNRFCHFLTLLKFLKSITFWTYLCALLSLQAQSLDDFSNPCFTSYQGVFQLPLSVGRRKRKKVPVVHVFEHFRRFRQLREGVV